MVMESSRDRFALWAEKALEGRSLIIATHREPYQHDRDGRGLHVNRSGGGVVALLDTVLQVTGGSWVAFASGNADEESVDRNYSLAVPPEDPKYTLRRLWLNENELEGYYSGFSNETLWPLCHQVWVRPKIDIHDWEAYKNVNRKFADAIGAEASNPESLIWVHDYHLALVPKLLRQGALTHPESHSIGFFWHIPWPPSETFRVLPWAQEFLEGILASDVVMFHERRYLLNFLQAVQGQLGAAVDVERGTVTYHGHTTSVRHYAASVDYEWFSAISRQLTDARSRLEESLGSLPRHLALTVSRADYVKGLLETVQGVDCFLTEYPEFLGNFTYILIAAPSRSSIPAFARLSKDLKEAVHRVNEKYQTASWTPIVYLPKNFDHKRLAEFYKASDVFIVGSLADGMNLVCKEFLASCDPTRASLALSCFTGASEGLSEAIQFNPYSSHSVAMALRLALVMNSLERRDRTEAQMRKVEQEDVFTWARSNLQAMLEQS